MFVSNKRWRSHLACGLIFWLGVSAALASHSDDNIGPPAPGVVRMADIIDVNGELATLIWDVSPGATDINIRDPQQLYNTAVCYHQGIYGKQVDLKTAFVLYSLAAEMGFPPSLNNLAGLYENGVNGLAIAKNPNRAFELYSRAAEMGYAPSEYALGVCYQRGIGVPINLEKALNIYTMIIAKYTEDYKESCTQYDYQVIAFAQCNLGLMYLNGNTVVTKDLGKARELLLEAASKGDMVAQNWLDKIT